MRLPGGSHMWMFGAGIGLTQSIGKRQSAFVVGD